MARQLSAIECALGSDAQFGTPGRHADGGGLYLVVNKGGSKQWVFLFRFGGRPREMGFGGLSPSAWQRPGNLPTLPGQGGEGRESDRSPSDRAERCPPLANVRMSSWQA